MSIFDECDSIATCFSAWIEAKKLMGFSPKLPFKLGLKAQKMLNLHPRAKAGGN